MPINSKNATPVSSKITPPPPSPSQEKIWHKDLKMILLLVHVIIFIICWLITILGNGTFPKHWLGWIVRIIFPEAIFFATVFNVFTGFQTRYYIYI